MKLYKITKLLYTASVQQIGRAFTNKGEEEWKEVGTRANNNTYLKQVHKTDQVQHTKQTCNKAVIFDHKTKFSFFKYMFQILIIYKIISRDENEKGLSKEAH